MQRMKVFLDTNIWSYIADHLAGDDLARAARRAGAEVLVAPAIVDEAREPPND
jgi:predicted nucleic acid-binding protein